MDSGATARVWRAPPALILFGALSLALGALAFATPFNHDEDQYLAAAVLASRVTLYRDFLYVQTPLYPELAAPLTRLAPGWTYLALRAFSAACGLAALGGVWTAQRRLGVSARVAAVAVALMASCYTFQYCASVVRNDALPMALLAWAIVALVGAVQKDASRPWRSWSLGGLLLGAAVSAKVTFAPLLGAAALFMGATALVWPLRATVGRALSFGAGAGVGLSPIALAWAGAPEAVRFALVGFWSGGPQRWYTANGLAHRMEPASKLLYGLGDLLLGPTLAALTVVLWDCLRPQANGVATSPAARLLDLMTLAGLLAAFAPSPTFKQYFAPLLAPLFVRLGLFLSAGRPPAWATGVLAVGLAVGVGVFGVKLGQAAWSGRWTPLAVEREDHWIGSTLRRLQAGGPIATLSAHAVIDSGSPLDRRFAGGAMLYRSGDGIDAGLRARLHLTSPGSLAADLDAQPPGAIVTGYEGAGGDTRVDLDAPLRAYARARGYVLRRSPSGAAQLYVRPPGSAHVVR